MAGPLIPVGIAVGKPIIKKYGRRLLEKVKPLVEKSLKKYKVKDRVFKGAKGASDKVKEKLVKIDKMKKINKKDIENVAQNKDVLLRNQKIDTQRKVMSELKNTRDKLSTLEKNVKKTFRDSRSIGGLISGKPKLAKKGWK
tara:strand:- start:10 stop:432 length:423 start_codon:yes stop_codon:yes gene_type:complete